MKQKIKQFLLTIISCVCMIFIIGYVCKTGLSEAKVHVETDVTQIIEEYVDIWVTKNIDIKSKSDIDSDTVGEYYWNTKVPVVYINEEWAKIKGTEYYLNRNNISESPNNFIDCDVPSNNSIKSYMDYRYITSKTSDQYKLQETLAYTGDNGLRMVNGRYCLALGSYYTTTIGQYVDIELENGEIIEGILGDCKADIHTDETNRMNPNGSVIEFVVDTEYLDPTARKMGDIGYVNDWDSKVVNIKVYDKIADFK